MAKKERQKKTSKGGNLGFEAKLWQAADALRNNMDAAEHNPTAGRFLRHRPHGEQPVVEMRVDKLCSEWTCPWR